MPTSGRARVDARSAIGVVPILFSTRWRACDRTGVEDAFTAENPRFTILDVLGDAWGSFSRCFATHARWDAGFMGLLFLTSCVTACFLFPVIGVGGMLGGGRGAVVVLAVLAIYAVVLVAMFALLALHQGVTLAITVADLRGEPTSISSAYDAARPRLLSIVGTMVARFGLDFLVGGSAMAAAIAVVAMTSEEPFESRIERSPELLLVLVAAYLGWIAWILVVRAFVGVSGPCAQSEGLSPFAALARSNRLLADHRLQMIGVRLLWGVIALVLYTIAYVPALLLSLAAQGGGASSLVTLLLLPYLFVWYWFMLLILSLDTVLEGAFFARLTRTTSREQLADVFA